MCKGKPVIWSKGNWDLNFSNCKNPTQSSMNYRDIM